MHVHTSRTWLAGFLPYARGPKERRIGVAAWCTLAPVEGLYFVRERSVGMLWAYLREFGVGDVARKVVSRRAEHLRNSKFLSVGAGFAKTTHGEMEATPLGFVAPCHPYALDEIVVPVELTFGLQDLASNLDAKRVRFCDLTGTHIAQALAALAGWSPFSGTPLASHDLEAALPAARALLDSVDWGRTPSLDGGACNAEPLPVPPAHTVTASLFGYGNYAKTVILPNIRPQIAVTTVHEVDPTQIPIKRGRVRWSTEPGVTGLDDGQVYLIAGFHHTHATLALEALRRNVVAVVEKPVATTQQQLAELVAHLKSKGGTVFACFHRRYSPFNRLLRQDLGVDDASPLSYHCSVYEVPLPARHWYRWPNSRGRIVCNGCHWIDHFLFLNGYARPTDYTVKRARDGTVTCLVELENDAVFTMVLTDRGSARIGVQDHVEVRAGTRTARVVNGSQYTAEGEHHIVRRTRTERMRAHRLMYRDIARRITAGQSGDSLQSIQVTGQLVLDLEEQVITPRTR